MNLPPVPFQATLKQGTRAKNVNGIDWGLVEKQYPLETKFTVSALLSDNRAKITSPQWDGTKDFYVNQSDLVPVSSEVPTTPTALRTPAGKLEVELPDGTILRNKDDIFYA